MFFVKIVYRTVNRKDVDLVLKFLKDKKNRKKITTIILVLATIISGYFLFKDPAPQEEKEENLGNIAEENIQEKKNNEVIVQNKFKKQEVKNNKDKDSKEDDQEVKESDYYEDKFGLKYKMTDIPQLGISTMLPVGWDISFEDPTFIYLRSTDPENYKIVEVALSSVIRENPSTPNSVAGDFYHKLAGRYYIHPYDYEMYPERTEVYPEDYYFLGDKDKKVWATIDEEDGYLEFPYDKKPKGFDTLVETQKFLAYAYDSETNFAGLKEKDLKGRMAISHRFMNVGKDLSQFIGVAGPTNLSDKIEEIANTIVSFSIPIKENDSKAEDVELTKIVKIAGKTFKVPEDYDVISSEGTEQNGTRLLVSNEISSVNSGITVSIFSHKFVDVAVKSLEPDNPEFLIGLTRAITPISDKTYDILQKINPDTIRLTHSGKEKFSGNVIKYNNVMLFLKDKNSATAFSSGIDFPSKGNLYIIDTGTDVIYGVYVQYNNTNKEYANELGDNIVKSSLK